LIESTIYFIITIGILVFVHEFGHFIAARMCGMRTDAFAIGFGKRLFGWNKVTGFTWGDLDKDTDLQGHTDYKLCLLPLGGYVKIAGMVDESFDTEFVNKEPKPWEFRAKPTYQKLFVITAGVLMNLLLAVAIYWGINFFQGKRILETTKIGVVQDSSLAYQAGFRSFDKIISVNGTPVSDWENLLNTLLIKNIGKDVDVTVERNGEKITFTAPKKILSKATQKTMFLTIGDTKPMINAVFKNSPAEKAGLKSGDIFFELNKEKVLNTSQVINIITSHKKTEIPIRVIRKNDTILTEVNPGVEGKIGVALGDAYIGPIKYKDYGLGESLNKSFSNIGLYTVLTFKMFSSVIKGDAALADNIGGPVKIAKYAAKSADAGFVPFLSFLALLSLSLAIINILPFPVLDGGHFVIILIEGIVGRELPVKVKIAIQNIGFVILLLLMVFIVYTDISSL